MNTQKLAGWGAIAMSFLTALSAAPYTLGDVAMLIPPKYKAPLFVASAIAAVVLKAIRDIEAAVKK